MKNLVYILLGLIAIGVASCNGNSEVMDDLNIDSLGLDSIPGDTLAMDTSAFVDSAGYVDQEAEIANEIEEKFGEQWDFCDCVVKNDSVNKAIDFAETDEEFDKILARMDEIDSHCKEMLTTPNTTPDERKKHERKVRKCLKNAN